MVQLTPEDAFVVLASDGLWDVMDDQQAVDVAKVPSGVSVCSKTAWQFGAIYILRDRWPDSVCGSVQEALRKEAPSGGSGHPPGSKGDIVAKAAATALVTAALKRGSQDNITAVVVLLPWGS